MRKLFITLAVMLIGSFAFANEKDVMTSVEFENNIGNVVNIEEASAYCTYTLYGYWTRTETFLFMTNETEVTYTFNVTGGCERCYGGPEGFTLDCWGRTF